MSAQDPMSTEPPALGRATLSEIVSQPDAWAKAYALLAERGDAIRAAWATAQPRQVVVTGCGSSYHAAQSAAVTLQGVIGVPATAVPASEFALHPDLYVADPAQTLLLALSRSGVTTEVLAAQDAFRRKGGRQVWAITCDPASDLAAAAEFVLPASMAHERSVVTTRGFSTLLFLAQGIAAQVGGADLRALGAVPEAARRLIEFTYGLAHQWGAEAGLDRFYFLGSGPLLGVAQEAALKMRMMAQTHSEAYPTLEMRHRAKTLLDEMALVVGLLGATHLRHEAAVLLDAAELGASTLALLPGKPNAGHVTVHLPDHLPWWAMPVLYLPVVQVMAVARALERGLDPDAPRQMAATVRLDRASFDAPPTP